jgi:hypothetical protein
LDVATPRPSGGLSAPDASALIVRVHLPPALDALRRANVPDARLGVPAHLTLLYPFVPVGKLEPSLRRSIAAIVAHHVAFDYHLTGPKVWPDTIYAGVDSGRPFLEIHRELAAAFPDYPIYQARVGDLVPHVTVAEGPAVADARTVEDPAWHALPTRRRAYSLELIAPGRDGRWSTVWRFRLPTID